MTKEITVESLCDEEIIDKIAETFKDVKESMKRSRTSTLWLQYMKMLDILRQFIKAERMENWRLQLKATYEMLPYFAASGHNLNLYAKSAYIYYQMMTKLEDIKLTIYDLFMKGHHVSRRSDLFWAGLTSYLVTE